MRQGGREGMEGERKGVSESGREEGGVREGVR